MPRNEASDSEANEFEMVLGNKQLLSVFFVVVILLGIFFTMGYVVGRNSAPVDVARRTDQTYDNRQNAPSAVPAPAPVKREGSPSEQSAETTSPAEPPAVP